MSTPRLSYEDVQTIISCIHNDACPPANLQFKIMVVPPDGPEPYPPGIAFEEGIYVLLNSSYENFKIIKPRVPAALTNRVLSNRELYSLPELPWSVGEAHFKRVGSMIHRKYSFGRDEYIASCPKTARVWNVVDEQGNENLDVRVLQVENTNIEQNHQRNTQTEHATKPADDIRSEHANRTNKKDGNILVYNDAKTQKSPIEIDDKLENPIKKASVNRDEKAGDENQMISSATKRRLVDSAPSNITASYNTPLSTPTHSTSIQSATTATVSSEGRYSARNVRNKVITNNTPYTTLQPSVSPMDKGAEPTPTEYPHMPDQRRLSVEDVKVIFSCVHDNWPPPINLDFKIIVSTDLWAKVSPPPVELEDGIYVIMRSSDGNTKHRVPSTLVDRVLLSVASKPAVSWKLSGPYEKAQLKRRNFAQPRKGYSTRGWIWTTLDKNGDESLDVRVCHFFSSSKKRSNNNLQSTDKGGNPFKKMKQYWGKQNKTLAQRLNTQTTHSTKHNEITGSENGSTISGTNRRVGNTVEVRSEKLCNSEEKKPMPIMTHQLVCNGETTPTINRAIMKITPSRTIPKSVWETKNKKRMMTPTRRYYTIDRMSKHSTSFSTPPPQSSFTMNGVNQTDIPLVSDFKLPPTQTTTMPDSRRLTIQEVQAIFDAILDNKCPPPIDFKIIVVPHDKLAFDPPSCEFEDGIYVILRSQLAEAVHIPTLFENRLLSDIDLELMHTCSWNCANQKHKKNKLKFQFRHCLPKNGSSEFCKTRRGGLWTMSYSNNIKYPIECRVLEVYYCATAAGNSRFTSNNSHQKGKAKIGFKEQHQHFIRKSSRTAKRTEQLIASKTGNNPGSTANKEIVKDIAELTRIFPRTTTKKFVKSFAPKTCSNQRSTVNTHLQTDQTRSDNIAQSIDISHHQNMPGKTMTTEGKYAKIPYEEVQLIFHSILHNECPRSTIDFKVVTVPFQHLAKSPPPYDFEVGIYFLLSSQKNEAITVPPMLSHKMLAYNDIGAMPFRRWATSGPQLSKSTASSYEFLIRTVYPGHGYSCSKRGHLWTLVKNGNEMTEYRLLQIRNYVATPKKSNKRGQTVQTNHCPQKKTKCDEANNHLSSGISQASTFHVSSDKFVTSDNKQYSVRSSACLQIQHSMSNIINEIIVDAIIKETTYSADGTESSNSKRVSPPFSALTAIAESDNAPSQKLATSTNKNLAQYEKYDEPSPSTQTSKEAEDTQQKRITVLEDFKERIGGIYNQIIVLPENLKQINAIKYNQIVILHENAKQKMLGIYNQLTIPDDFKDGISIICNEIIALTENTKQRIFEIYYHIINYPIPPNNWTLHNNQFNMFALLLILSLIGVRIFISTLVLTCVMVAAAVCASAAFAKIKMLERDLQILKEFHSKQLRELEECHNAETELCEKEHMEFVSNMITEHREEVDSLKNLMDVYIEASCDTLVMASQGFGRASGSSRRDL